MKNCELRYISVQAIKKIEKLKLYGGFLNYLETEAEKLEENDQKETLRILKEANAKSDKSIIDLFLQYMRFKYIFDLKPAEREYLESEAKIGAIKMRKAPIQSEFYFGDIAVSLNSKAYCVNLNGENKENMFRNRNFLANNEIYCGICAKECLKDLDDIESFGDLRKFVEHYLKFHGTIALFACHCCSKAFTTPAELMAHDCEDYRRFLEVKKTKNSNNCEEMIAWHFLVCSDCGVSTSMQLNVMELVLNEQLSKLVDFFKIHSSSKLLLVTVYSSIPLIDEPIVTFLTSFNEGYFLRGGGCDIEERLNDFVCPAMHDYENEFPDTVKLKKHVLTNHFNTGLAMFFTSCHAAVHNKRFGLLKPCFVLCREKRTRENVCIGGMRMGPKEVASEALPINWQTSADNKTVFNVTEDVLSMLKIDKTVLNLNEKSANLKISTEFHVGNKTSWSLHKTNMMVGNVHVSRPNDDIPREILNDCTICFKLRSNLDGDDVHKSALRDKVAVCTRCRVICNGEIAVQQHVENIEKHKILTLFAGRSYANSPLPCPDCNDMLCSIEGLRLHLYNRHNQYYTYDYDDSDVSYRNLPKPTERFKQINSTLGLNPDGSFSNNVFGDSVTKKNNFESQFPNYTTNRRDDDFERNGAKRRRITPPETSNYQRIPSSSHSTDTNEHEVVRMANDDDQFLEVDITFDLVDLSPVENNRASQSFDFETLRDSNKTDDFTGFDDSSPDDAVDLVGSGDEESRMLNENEDDGLANGDRKGPNSSASNDNDDSIEVVKVVLHPPDDEKYTPSGKGGEKEEEEGDNTLDWTEPAEGDYYTITKNIAAKKKTTSSVSEEIGVIYGCKRCTGKFPSLKCIQVHLKENHARDFDDVYKEDYAIPKNTPMNLCLDCATAFECRQMFENHIKTHKERNFESDPCLCCSSGIDRCKYVGNQKIIAHYNDHKWNHFSFTCSRCPRPYPRFSTYCQMMYHLHFDHEASALYFCKLCYYATTQADEALYKNIVECARANKKDVNFVLGVVPASMVTYQPVDLEAYIAEIQKNPKNFAELSLCGHRTLKLEGNAFATCTDFTEHGVCSGMVLLEKELPEAEAEAFSCDHSPTTSIIDEFFEKFDPDRLRNDEWKSSVLHIPAICQKKQSVQQTAKQHFQSSDGLDRENSDAVQSTDLDFGHERTDDVRRSETEKENAPPMQSRASPIQELGQESSKRQQETIYQPHEILTSEETCHAASSLELLPQNVKELDQKSSRQLRQNSSSSDSRAPSEDGNYDETLSKQGSKLNVKKRQTAKEYRNIELVISISPTEICFICGNEIMKDRIRVVREDAQLVFQSVLAQYSQRNLLNNVEWILENRKRYDFALPHDGSLSVCRAHFNPEPASNFLPPKWALNELPQRLCPPQDKCRTPRPHMIIKNAINAEVHRIDGEEFPMAFSLPTKVLCFICATRQSSKSNYERWMTIHFATISNMWRVVVSQQLINSGAILDEIPENVYFCLRHFVPASFKWDKDCVVFRGTNDDYPIMNFFASACVNRSYRKMANMLFKDELTYQHAKDKFESEFSNCDKCEFCQKTVTSSLNWFLHLHHNVRGEMICMLCQKTAKCDVDRLDGVFVDHLVECHKNAIVYNLKCFVGCSRVFDDVEEYREHLFFAHKDVLKFQNPCGLAFADKQQHELHRSLHKSSARKSEAYCCTICGTINGHVVLRDSTVLTHELFHAIETALACNICCMIFDGPKKFDDFEAHFGASHTSARRKLCQDCSMHADSDHSRKIHMMDRIHDIDGYFKLIDNATNRPDWKSGEAIAKLICLDDSHSNLPFLHIEAYGSRRQRAQIYDEGIDGVVCLHLQVLYNVHVAEDVLAAHATQIQLLQLFNKEILQKRKAENWFLPIFYQICTDLRFLSKEAENIASRDDEGEATTTFFETAANAIMESYRTCVVDARTDLHQSKKVAMLNVTNQLFRIYFKINKLNLLKPLIRAIDNCGALKDEFSMADKVTYNYFLGRKAMFDADLTLAEKSLTYAFNNCPPEAFANKRKVLIYLIPVKMFLGHMPTEALLKKYQLDEFMEVVNAVKNGHVGALDNALNNHETFFIRCGIFLMLEKLRMITFRTLFKKTAKIVGSHQIPLEVFQIALKFVEAEEMDTDELECVIANLIATRKIKGYLAHNHSKLVISKTNAFPNLSTLAL
ncbi:unnamed protein product [Caenorhabditis bovis]|uniref:PCI domain-containing protein 2 homolog n=1 Tax=Caenorhabditis bovis TaxID=2654633 RepID=A0A8S1EUA7_9PELO|nr:unnamed protein product [Caenorhabditis bovis]